MASGRHHTSPILAGMQYSVTAVVVSYNRAGLLDECLSALNAQTRRPDSLVIVDNASTDGALQVARDFAGRTPIPAYILELRENTGAPADSARALRTPSPTVPRNRESLNMCG